MSENRSSLLQICFARAEIVVVRSLKKMECYRPLMLLPDFGRVAGGRAQRCSFHTVPESGLAVDLLHVDQETNLAAAWSMFICWLSPF